MAVLKLGSKGKTVGELQSRLRELGFDKDEVLGPATNAAVIAFQESRGLLPDGLVGPITRQALEDDTGSPGQPRIEGPVLEIDRSQRLLPGQYFPEVHAKDLIVLHHTAGASAASTINWWREDDLPIATAYIVERDGSIFELFDPRDWAYHLGIQGLHGRVDRRSIGIEIASEGGLRKQGNRFYAFDRVQDGNRYTGPRHDHGSKWRGYRYYAAYSDEQLSAVTDLVNHLCDTFAIERRTPADHQAFTEDLYDYQGVVGHHHLRKDKSDLHTGFDWARFVELCALALE